MIIVLNWWGQFGISDNKWDMSMSLSMYGGSEVITIATISIILSNKWSDFWARLSQFAYHQKIFWDEKYENVKCCRDS